MTDELIADGLPAPFPLVHEERERSGGRRAIVVAGMHRSGTSAVARVLGLLGAGLPANVAPPADDNQTGFWEPLSIVALNDALLESAGSSWDDVSRLPPSWFRSHAAASFYGRATTLLEDEFGSAGLFVLKDPRVCRLVPFWEEVFRDAGVRTSYVVPVRSPLEVAASLKRRNGFSAGKSLLLWLRHVLDVEAATRGRSRVFLSYGELLRSWHGEAARIASTLGLSWSRDDHATHVEIERFLSEQHRHHVYEDYELAAAEDIAGWVKRAYAGVLSLASSRAGDGADLDLFDQLRRELDDADAAFGPLLAETALASEERRAAADGLRADLERVEAEAELLRGERDGLATQLGAAANRGSELEQLLGQAQGRATSAEQESLRFEQSAEALRRELREAEARTSAADDRETELRAALESARTGAEHAEREAGAMRGRALGLEQELAGERDRLAAGSARAADLEQALAASQQHADDAHSRVVALRKDLAGLQAELTGAVDRTTAAEQALEAAKSQLAVQQEVSDRFRSEAERLARHAESAERELERERQRLHSELALHGEVTERHRREAGAAQERARVADERLRQGDAELIRLRGAVADLQTSLERRSLRGRAARVGRLPRASVQAMWLRRLSPWTRLRLRYASQLLSWCARRSPRTSARWIHAYFALRHSGLFDYRFYVMRYPDVIRARMNPLMHYIEHGAREGRDPSAAFNTRAYLEAHPDLDPLRMNPLMDYRRRRRESTSPSAQPFAVPPLEPMAALPRGLPVAHGGVDIIRLPIIDWHYRFQRPQQLLARFAAAGHQAFYAGTRFHEAGPDIVVGALADGISSLSLPGPSSLVIYRDELADADIEKLVEAFGRLRAALGIERAVVVVDLPFWRSLALELRRQFGWRLIYDCMDDHAGFLEGGAASQETRARIHANEEILIKESDAVLATSLGLYERVAPLARQTVLVPNASDFEHFSRDVTAPPDWLPELRSPVVGYYGAISSWFDIELVEQAARARPEWSFVLAGSTFGADVSRLERLENVVLPGERPYDDMPALLAQFDVACIPFLLNDLTQATNPVKFYEYLSRGKPVVSVDLPELEPYRDHYYSAGRSGAELVAQVERALVESTPERVTARIELARANTWQERFDRIRPLVRSWYGRVSIVIVSFDNARYLRLCLESVWQRTDHHDYEVVVVENGSDPEVSAYLVAEEAKHDRLRVVRPETNLGFARANNLAVAGAQESEYVVLLNDDTVVTDGWLERLIGHLQDETVGLVGPVTNWAGNEARIDVDYEDDLTGLQAFASRHTSHHRGETFELPVLAMYCVAVRRELFDRLGGLDEQYEVGMFEDDDFALSVARAGLRVVCAEDVFVHHWGRASFSRLDAESYDRIFESNRERFEQKWEQAWLPHRGR